MVARWTYWLYVGYLLLSAVGAAAIGYWVYTRTEAKGRVAFVALMGVSTPWTALQAMSLLVSSEPVMIGLEYVRHVVGLTGVLLWGYFAFEYTDRSTSLRKPIVATLFGGYLVVLGALVSGPITGLYWSSISVVDRPFQYVALALGPFSIVRQVWTYAVIGVSFMYLTELFLKSRHRSSRSVFVLLVSATAASAPNAATLLGLGPLPGFDYTPFGVFPLSVGVAYAVFRLGMFDVRPVARDNLIEQVDDALLVLDDEGKLIDYNRPSESLSSILADGDPIGEPFETVVPSLATEIEFPDAVGEQVAEQFSLDGKSGREYYSVHVSTVENEGAVAGYSIVLRDITESEEYRKQLERKNKQLDEFTSTVSHDLRNPIQSATLQAAIMEDALENLETSSPDALANLQTEVSDLQGSLTRMEDIITDLRTLVKKGETVETTQALEFGAVVTDAWETVTSDDATLEIRRDGTVEADRSRLRHVLENLFRNAIEHVGPDVTVTVELTDTGFVVADDGPGIPPEERDAVFQYGYTTREEGTGLGLAIVRTMVESHDWSITIDADDTGGTTFRVTDAITEPADESDARTTATVPEN